MDGSQISLRARQGSSSHIAPSIGRNNFSDKNHPVSDKPTCVALNEDGSRCHVPVTQKSHKFCLRHNRELKKLNDAYKSEERESASIKNDEQYKEDEQQIQALIKIREKIVKLRGQVQMRFYSTEADNLGHSQRILILQAEIKKLLEKLMLQTNNEPGDATGKAQTILL